MQKFILFLVALSLFGCDKLGDLQNEISKIPIEVSILRFDKQFANSPIDSLGPLKKKVPYVFSSKDSR